MSEKENKSLEEFIRTIIRDEVVNRIDLYDREILKLLNKINCYFPYLADCGTRNLLEKDRNKILSYADEKTDSFIDILSEKLSLLSEVPVLDTSNENEELLSENQAEEQQSLINKSITNTSPQGEFDWNLEFLKDDKNER